MPDCHMKRPHAKFAFATHCAVVELVFSHKVSENERTRNYGDYNGLVTPLYDDLNAYRSVHRMLIATTSN
jgi:hypothetical protein